MRKVDLRLNEEYKYEVIKKLVESQGNKKTAAIRLNCTQRHVNRMIQGYLSHGKAFFLHKNRGRPPINKLSEETRKDILDLYSTLYDGSNFTHFTELLSEKETIHASRSTIRSVIMEQNILSPMATRKTKSVFSSS